MTSGVYAIIHKATGRRYIGQSADVARRLRQHQADLHAGTHHCVRLQRAFSKHGAGQFEFLPMEAVPVGELDRVEQGYLDAGFAFGVLYNTARCAEAPARGAKRSPEACAANGARKRAEFASAEARERMGRKIAATLARPEVKAKMVGPKSESAKRAISEARRALLKTERGRLAIAAAMKTRATNETWVAGTKARGRAWRSNEQIVAAHDAAIAARSLNPAWQEAMRDRNQAMAKDPKWQQAIRAGHATEAARRNHGEATRRAWAERRADPVAYAAWCAKISEGRRRAASG